GGGCYQKINQQNSRLAIFANTSYNCFSGTEAAMPTRNVNLTPQLDRFVIKKVKTGRFENASEVVRAGLRSLEREEREYEAKLAALRSAIDDGDASGIATGDVFARVRRKLNFSKTRR
ncbi:MAG TPA: type II toxin-antitoxin system ParD family antitoxin, partial [Candidatus Angelobacter sp.]|nr:type II toxin-antitoxin system ParD family antitoxin [Candidatus Angelobacter sp.]